MSLRALHPVGAGVELFGVTPLASAAAPDRVEECTAYIRHMLAAAGLGGMPVHGDIERVSNLDEPGGYDPLTHEIWMDDRWYRALELFVSDPAAHARKAVTFHALVHEHVHVNSAIHVHLRDRGFLDPAQRFLEEACVETLAQRITERLLGRSFCSPGYRPLVDAMTWLHRRTGRDVAFEVWVQPTLSSRIRATNDAIAAALAVPPPGRGEAAWLTRFRELLARSHDDLFLLLDAPDLFELVTDELRRACRPGFAWRLVRKDRRELCSTFDRALAARRDARATRPPARGMTRRQG
jgi:hypothetical protein